MAKSNQNYPTDINDTEWAQIAPLLPEDKTIGRPREYLWREILNGIFYVTKNGCVWRAMPHDLPPWQTVYHYFWKFRNNGLWEKINTVIREAVRIKAGRDPKASAMIIDSQSIKSSEGGESIGFDGGKKINGRKRHLVVDMLGLLVLAHVTSGNVQDVHAGKKTLMLLKTKIDLLGRLLKIFADGGYRGELIAWTKENLNVDIEVVLKLGDQKGFQVLPKRWVIERTNAWISRQRRLARDYERSTSSSEAFIYIAMTRIGLRRLAHC